MALAELTAQRSTCNRGHVGAVIVRDYSILSTGYNGAPSGLPHCTDVGCLVYESRNPNGEIEENCFRSIHAEINAIAQAAKNGVSIRGANIYITHSPCFHCLKVLINIGITTVYYRKPYKLRTINQLAEDGNVVLTEVE